MIVRISYSKFTNIARQFFPTVVETVRTFPDGVSRKFRETVLNFGKFENFSQNPAAQPVYLVILRVFYAFPVTHTSTFPPKTFRGTTSHESLKSLVFGFSLKRNVMCHFFFFENLVRFPKFGNSGKRKTVGKPRGNFWENFPDFQNRNLKKFVHFGFSETALRSRVHW
jgi:hypothetical protein